MSVVLADTLAPAHPPVATSRRPRGWVLALAAGLLLAGLLIIATSFGAEGGADVLGMVAAAGRSLTKLRWQFAAALVALAGLHYLASAIAARAASGLPLQLREAILVEFAAAAANRITPAGLGGSALHARYFTRRGLDGPGAVGAVGTMAVLGAVSDLLVLSLLVLGIQALGVGGGAHELDALLTHIRHLLGPVRSPWLLVAVAVVATGLTVWWLARHRRRRDATTVRRFWAPVRRLAKRPAALATLVAASGSTTLLMGLAFVTSTAVLPGPQPTASVPVVLAAFMLGSAAGSSVPVPAGLGSTEAALIAVLMSVGVPASHAVPVVIIYRVVTFWAPAAVGLVTSRSLYRRRAI
ncbi:MAG TPA: lysylphosphatidylglycerol synthase domain-containing protein [Jatrophihabitans sp.]|nr:lysylphosphatidylglycerol synthase domain-containing protein [Jatrophihabitans sp.]